MSGELLELHPVLPCRDVARAVGWYEGVGFACAFRDDQASPRYAAMRRDGVELHLQWADETQWVPGLDRPVLRVLVRDVDALYAEFAARGVGLASGSPWAAPGDTPWGTREFHVRDSEGNGLQFYRGR